MREKHRPPASARALTADQGLSLPGHGTALQPTEPPPRQGQLAHPFKSTQNRPSSHFGMLGSRHGGYDPGDRKQVRPERPLLTAWGEGIQAACGRCSPGQGQRPPERGHAAGGAPGLGAHVPGRPPDRTALWRKALAPPRLRLGSQ